MKINWELLGPVLGALIIILTMVFGFILRMRKMDRQSYSPLPKNDPGTLDKKTLCFNHESRISSNETAITNVGKQLDKQEINNRKDHEKIFEKLEETKLKIIEAIKNNS